ncbi:DUF1611 domain-containing protein [Natrononativus amylolyticus]|uniref:DUF1611 domain-containing protein n=1 Tax=Natrononativus amylolyticus TaxID=2963434 RepID=UPI0020CFBCB9|nr:DUF1611 domain-containing protein [Natrononativus amylolyticus]
MNLRDHFDVPAQTIVLAEGKFGTTGAKTANGVVAQSELFDACAVVDSTNAGRTAADVLARDDVDPVPIVSSVEEALENNPDVTALVIGVAPAGGALPESWKPSIRQAMQNGCHIVSGMHTYLSEDATWQSLAEEYDVTLFDVRKPPEENDRTIADGSVDDLDCDIVLTLGTDCSVGKRTTTFELYKAAQDAGLDAGWVATGQTGIMTGAHRGVAIDGVPADFTSGIVERMVVEVGREHSLVFVEGQGALTHRAYSGVTLAILHGSWPDVAVLADQPDRNRRTHPHFPVEGVEKERALVESLSDADVVALSTWGEPDAERDKHELPAANIYHENGPQDLLTAVCKHL